MHRASRSGLLFWLAIFMAMASAPDDASGQSIDLSFQGAPLSEVLRELQAQSPADIVYAQRLVQGLMVTCVFRGTAVEAALACVLRGTGLEARATGAGQFVIVASSPRARGRTISGIVTEAGSGAPLAGAHVLLPDLSRGAITNRTGFFAFPTVPGGPHRLRVSYIGFATVDTLAQAARGQLHVRLRPHSITAQDVLVESMEPRPGDRTPLPGMTAPPLALLERLPAALGGEDLLEALSWLPGIRRAGEVTGGLVVRGAGPDQNLYLLDGAPVYHPWHAFSLISTFQTETFRSVQVYRGAFPAEYGGRLSAVLDAELSDGRGTEPSVRAGLNTHSARFLIETPITDKASFMLGGRRSYIDRLIGKSHPVSDDLGRRDTLRTGYYFYDWTAKLVFRPDPVSRFSLTSYRGRDDLDLRLPFDLSLDFTSWLRPTDLLFEVSEFWRNRVVSARYERLLSSRVYLTVTGHDSRYEASEGAFLQPTLSSSVRSAYRVDIRDLGLRTDLDYFRSDRNQIKVGGQVLARDFGSDVDAVVNYNPDLSERLKESSATRAVELSGYVQNTWRAHDRVEVRSGLRAVAFGADRLVRLEPRLSFQWSVDPRLFLIRGAYTRSYQYLHRIRDRHSFLYDIVSSRWIPATRDTAPARGTEYSAGLESRPGSWHLQVGAYHRNQSHVLLPRDVFQSKDGLAGPGIEIGTLLGQYVAGDARVSGLETGATYAGASSLVSLALTLERSRTRATEGGETGFYPARYDVPVSARVFGEQRRNQWSYNIGLTARSGYPVTVPEARYEVSGPLDVEPTTYLHRPAIHNGRLPLYWRVDASVARSFTWLDGQWVARLQLYNVFNHRNVIDRFFEPDGTAVRLNDRRGLPILPLFEIQLRL